MSYFNIKEEELKNKVAKDVFWQFDCTRIIGNVDFCVQLHNKQESAFESQSLLWAEAKKNTADIYKSITQLILTIGKARTFDTHLPPPFIGAFDAEKIAFVEYVDISDIFYQNDFNWNVTPSNHNTKEFLFVLDKVTAILNKKALIFNYDNDEKQLQKFIRQNLLEGKFGITKIKIDKNNFMVIYNKWLAEVKNTILVNWDKAKASGIIDGDFYLADILSQDNITLKDKLYVVLNNDKYELDRKIDDSGFDSIKSVGFRDGQTAHTQFWNRYDRPPLAEYWEYIVSRRDLLVPQDVRERKGSFYTPLIWVELSQKYIADTLGVDWQDEYYIWDCAAGTGNLLTGLTNKYNIWASTLDQQDVDVMKDRIDNGANLLKDHVFQFDFLNDEFTKLPKPLQDIINDPEKRKKLVIYINPPYAESNGKVSVNRSDIQKTMIHKKYSRELDKVKSELYAQFLIRIYYEIPDCFLCQFSKLKLISAPNSKIFRNYFLAKLEKLFIVPADTFDNVKGKFPIGFFIWNLKEKIIFNHIEADVYDQNSNTLENKNIYSNDDEKGNINNWLRSIKKQPSLLDIGTLMADSPDFQSNNYISILNNKGKRHGIYVTVNVYSIKIISIYFTIRNIIESTWINDRDIYLYPNENWEQDIEFQNDCLAYILFDSQNQITSSEGTNHWIPFKESEVNAREKFDSNFMTDYISGKIKADEPTDLFAEQKTNTALEFSDQAKAVFDAGRNLWRYYHSQENINVNASLYDIREHFQGRNEAGRMNSKSDDKEYMDLIQKLRSELKLLAKQIEPKVYEYGFLKK